MYVSSEDIKDPILRPDVMKNNCSQRTLHSIVIVLEQKATSRRSSDQKHVTPTDRTHLHQVGDVVLGKVV